jgi:DMSO/TMAO reductase YedYZ molybdopterin-dependent catalytic subunit
MSGISRRTMIRRGLAAAAGLSGLAAAERIADRYGLVPPDHGGVYGPGVTLTYAAQRLLTRHSLAREFDRSQISNPPFANETGKPSAEFTRLRAGGFADWRLTIEGLVARPASLSIDDIKRFPVRKQITEIACEEGWSYVAEWIGAPLVDLLHAAGILPQARYVAYFSTDPDWWESIDMGDALHPQTLVAYAMNDGDLPVPFGGPLRLRVPRQLGYKSIKYVNRLVVTDSLKRFGKGLGSAEPESGYSWYAGI